MQWKCFESLVFYFLVIDAIMVMVICHC